MPNIRPISDLRNNSNEISEFCQLEIYAKLAEAEAEILSGEEGVDFFKFARKLV